MPASPVLDSAHARELVRAWEDRTVGELRAALDDVGWDEQSLNRVLLMAGEPPAKRPLPAAALQATPRDDDVPQHHEEEARKRPRHKLVEAQREEDDDEAQGGSAADLIAKPTPQRPTGPTRALEAGKLTPQHIKLMTSKELKARGASDTPRCFGRSLRR